MRVLLISMPWPVVHMPMIGIATLRAVLAERHPSVIVDERYCHLEWLDHVTGLEVGALDVAAYERIADDAEERVGNWVFAAALHGGSSYRQDEYRAHLAERGREAEFEALARLQPIAAAWIESLADDIAQARPDIVGFSVNWMQDAASLALARALARSRPVHRDHRRRRELRRAAGPGPCPQLPVPGLRCERRGRGQPACPPRCHRGWPHGGAEAPDPARIPGVAARRPDGSVNSTPDMMVDMAAVPVPDYGAWFEQINRSRHGDGILARVELPLEQSPAAAGGGPSIALHLLRPQRDRDHDLPQQNAPSASLDELIELARPPPRRSTSASPSQHPRLRLLCAPSCRRSRGSGYDLHLLRRDQGKPQERSAPGVACRPALSCCNRASRPCLPRACERMRKGISAFQNIMLLRNANDLGLDV